MGKNRIRIGEDGQGLGCTRACCDKIYFNYASTQDYILQDNQLQLRNETLIYQFSRQE